MILELIPSSSIVNKLVNFKLVATDAAPSHVWLKFLVPNDLDLVLNAVGPTRQLCN